MPPFAAVFTLFHTIYFHYAIFIIFSLAPITPFHYAIAAFAISIAIFISPLFSPLSPY
jgi:hypothetical protein